MSSSEDIPHLSVKERMAIFQSKAKDTSKTNSATLQPIQPGKISNTRYGIYGILWRYGYVSYLRFVLFSIIYIYFYY
jgi:hypothetical protein